MAFNLQVRHGNLELCDKCKKPSTAERPLVDIWTTGPHYDQRNFIQIHKDCLLKAIAKQESLALQVTS